MKLKDGNNPNCKPTELYAANQRYTSSAHLEIWPEHVFKMTPVTSAK